MFGRSITWVTSVLWRSRPCRSGRSCKVAVGPLSKANVMPPVDSAAGSLPTVIFLPPRVCAIVAVRIRLSEAPAGKTGASGAVEGKLSPSAGTDDRCQDVALVGACRRGFKRLPWSVPEVDPRMPILAVTASPPLCEGGRWWVTGPWR